MKPVDQIVQNLLLPAIIGETISEKERNISINILIRRGRYSII